jgi:hypothetical protein
LVLAQLAAAQAVRLNKALHRAAPPTPSNNHAVKLPSQLTTECRQLAQHAEKTFNQVPFARLVPVQVQELVVGTEVHLRRIIIARRIARLAEKPEVNHRGATPAQQIIPVGQNNHTYPSYFKF